MVKQKQAFLSILAIELDDLDQDIELLIREYEEKHNKDEISNYVFQENLALMQRELFGVQGLQQALKNISTEEVDTVEELHKMIIGMLEARIRANGLPRSILNLVSRKMDKVLRYVGRL